MPYGHAWRKRVNAFLFCLFFSWSLSKTRKFNSRLRLTDSPDSSTLLSSLLWGLQTWRARRRVCPCKPVNCSNRLTNCSRRTPRCSSWSWISSRLETTLRSSSALSMVARGRWKSWRRKSPKLSLKILRLAKRHYQGCDMCIFFVWIHRLFLTWDTNDI